MTLLDTEIAIRRTNLAWQRTTLAVVVAVAMMVRLTLKGVEPLDRATILVVLLLVSALLCLTRGGRGMASKPSRTAVLTVSVSGVVVVIGFVEFIALVS